MMNVCNILCIQLYARRGVILMEGAVTTLENASELFDRKFIIVCHVYTMKCCFFPTQGAILAGQVICVMYALL